MTTTNNPLPAPEVSFLKLAIDFGPLLIFFSANFIAKKYVGKDAIYWGTGAFMVATVLAMIASRIVSGKVSAILWFTGAMVLVFGGLTIWLKDDRFIKIKPTIYNAAMGLVLMGGLLRGKSLIKLLLGPAMPPMNEIAWRTLTWRWAWFFLFSAGLNEVIWRNFSNDFWLKFKFADFAITMIFAAANMPFVLKNELRLTNTPTKENT